MKKKLALILLSGLIIFSCVGTVAASEKPLIAVFDFSTNRITQEDMKTITELVSSTIFESGEYAVLDAAQRDALLEEQNFSLSGLSDEDNQLKAGKMLSAEYIVTGSISKVEERFLMTIKIISTETSLTSHSTKGTWDTISDLIDGIDPLVAELLNKGTGISADSVAINLDENQVKPEPDHDVKTEGTPRLSRQELITYGIGGAGTVVLGTGIFLIANGLIDYNEAYDAYQSAPLSTTADEWDQLWSDVESTSDAKKLKGTIGLTAVGAGAGMLGYAVWRLFFAAEAGEADTASDINQLFFLPVQNGIAVGGHIAW